MRCSPIIVIDACTNWLRPPLSRTWARVNCLFERFERAREREIQEDEKSQEILKQNEWTNKAKFSKNTSCIHRHIQCVPYVRNERCAHTQWRREEEKIQMHTCRFGISAYETSRLTHFYISTLNDCCHSSFHSIFLISKLNLFFSWSNLNWSVERWNLRIINDSTKNYFLAMKNVNGSLSSIRRETGILRCFSWSFSIVITWL